MSDNPTSQEWNRERACIAWRSQYAGVVWGHALVLFVPGVFAVYQAWPCDGLGDLIAVITGCGLIVAGTVLIYGALAHTLNVTELECGPKHISVRTRPVPYPGARKRSVEVARLLQVYSSRVGVSGSTTANVIWRYALTAEVDQSGRLEQVLLVRPIGNLAQIRDVETWLDASYRLDCRDNKCVNQVKRDNEKLNHLWLEMLEQPVCCSHCGEKGMAGDGFRLTAAPVSSMRNTINCRKCGFPQDMSELPSKQGAGERH